MAVVWLVIGTFTVIGVHFRFVKTDNLVIITHTEVVAALFAGITGALTPMAFIGTKRVDGGVRFTGLTSMLAVGAVAVAVLGVIAAVIWRPIVGAEAVPGSLYDQLFSNPLSAVTIFCLLLAITAGGLATMIPMAAGAFPPVVRMIGLVLWLGILLSSVFIAVAVFGTPSSVLLLFAWFIAAVLAMAALIAVGLLIQRSRRVKQVAWPYEGRKPPHRQR